MSSRWWTLGVVMCYLFLVFFEGFFVSIPFFTSGSRVSAADHKPLVLRSIENLTPRATYQMEGFDTIGVRFVLTQEIRAHQISADCPGDVHVVQVHVDMGIEYSVVYRPSEYCEVVRFFIGDIEIHKVVWDRWGSILEALLDIPSSLLTAQVADIDVKIEKGGYGAYAEEYYRFIRDILFEILASREDPSYLVPVPGSQIPTKSSYLPNAGRPYRAGYTDGIHHGWDFYGDYGDEIVSLDDGVVIYTKKDFTWNDFESIKFDDPHSDRRAREHHHDHHHDENLDILRGNQIWIKTMTGDVVFYSHFDHINASLKAGDIVSRGEYLGTIGTTGVPFRDFDQYHLHIPLMMNPFDPDKVGKYSRLDIMRWDWYGRYKTELWILEHQQQLFSYE